MEVRGSTIENVPSSFSFSCWFWWPCWWLVSGVHCGYQAETYLFMILEAILVLVCLLTANDGAFKGFNLLGEGELRHVGAIGELLLLLQTPGQLILITAHLVVLERSLQLLLAQSGALLAKQTLARLVNGAVESRHASGKVGTTKVHVHARHAHQRLVVGVGKVHVELGRGAGVRGIG